MKWNSLQRNKNAKNVFLPTKIAIQLAIAEKKYFRYYKKSPKYEVIINEPKSLLFS